MKTLLPGPMYLMACAGILLTGVSPAQVPDAKPAGGGPAPGAPAAQPAQGGNQKNGGFLGGDVPLPDPGTENLTWGGKTWNVNNNRLFQARFEKYLNAPEETTGMALGYQQTVTAILNLLAPGNATVQNVDKAFGLLPRGSRYDIDAHLCDGLADAVYSAWRAQNSQNRLSAANEALEREKSQQYWNARHAGAADGSREAGPTGKSGKGSKGGPTSNQLFEDAMTQAQSAKRLGEIEALITSNQVKREINSIQAKVEFQALILQLFLQRRFQHVLMATRFYRAVFSDGDTKLNVGKETSDLFAKSSGMPPTVGTIDALANEALRDVREGVQAFHFLLEKQELKSATKRLAEAFAVGEFVPEIRTLPREKKRQALDFTHKSNQLISAIEVKDYTLAEQLVNDLGKIARDFDSSKPMAAIKTAQEIAAMHMAKAQNAALKGDNQTLEAELAAATELWPRNPALHELAQRIFQAGDIQQKAVIDFEQLLSQKNYRQIYDDRVRFIGALAFYPDKQAQLREVLEKMQTIEGSITRAAEMVRQSNYPGAWESVERISQEFPDDNKLSKTRAELTPHAADFVRTLQDAQDMEKRDQVGASLALYLKARKLYPASDFAGAGVDRLVKRIVPES